MGPARSTCSRGKGRCGGFGTLIILVRNRWQPHQGWMDGEGVVFDMISLMGKVTKEAARLLPAAI